MKNENNLETEISKSAGRGRLAVNFIGVTIILFVVLGCSRLQSALSSDESAGGNDNSAAAADNGKKKDKKTGEKTSLKEAIVGEWEGKMQGRTTTVKFTADGRITLGGKPARYKVLDEETIAIADGGDENYNERTKIKIVGDTLTVSDPSGKQIGEFIRAGGTGGDDDDGDSSKESSDEDSSSGESSGLTDSTESREDKKLRNNLDGLNRQFIRADQMADKAEVERILADDSTVTRNGKNYGKREFIESMSPNSSRVSSQPQDSRFIKKEENRVILEHKLTVEYKTKTENDICRSEFVKNDKWQIKRLCFELKPAE